MDKTESYAKHYIAVDEQGRIVDGWSDGPYPARDTSDAICINSRGSYQFRLTPDGEENPELYTGDDMIPVYRYEGSRIIQRTPDEIEDDRAALLQPDPEAPASDSSVWDELDAAYQEGVNSAYEQ